MNIVTRCVNTLVWMWRLTELAAKVGKAEDAMIAMDSRIDARLDKSWQDLDTRLDAEKTRAAADRAALREELAYLRGTIAEIHRQRHGSGT